MSSSVRFVAHLHPEVADSAHDYETSGRGHTRPAITARHRWVLDSAAKRALSGEAGLEVIVALDLGNGRTVDLTDAGGPRARIPPPMDAGTKTGQMQTLRAPIDGGRVSALFKYKTRAARWELDSAFVEWSLAKASSREAAAVRRLVDGIQRERAREESAGAASGKKTFVCSDEHAARHLAYIDEDIAETEQRIAEDQLSLLRLRSKREQSVSDRAAALSLAAAEEAAVRALRARVDALVEEAFPDAGQQQQA